MSDILGDYINKRLTEVINKGLYRKLRTIKNESGTEVVFNGKRYISFASNDYLGLARHPEIIAAAKLALDKYGAGAGASRLVSGDLGIHHELEERIASFKGREAARVFSSGFLANIGLISTLVGPGDAIVSDERNHSSIIDACRLSKADILIYRHLDMDSLGAILSEARNYNNILVVTESVFSIDGDIAPVDKIVELTSEFGAWSMIDEAHATGVIGSKGRGAEELFDCMGQVDIVMGTLSKAVGSQGGFISGSQELMELLVNESRSFIFSTGLAPSSAAAAAMAFDIIENEPEYRARLFRNIRHVNKLARELGLPVVSSETPIIPVIIGTEKNAVEAFESLMKEGLFVPVMRYPTVPKGKACLRISINSLHSFEQLNRLIEVMSNIKYLDRY